MLGSMSTGQQAIGSMSSLPPMVPSKISESSNSKNSKKKLDSSACQEVESIELYAPSIFNNENSPKSNLGGS
jgi:hypothetical protein